MVDLEKRDNTIEKNDLFGLLFASYGIGIGTGLVGRLIGGDAKFIAPGILPAMDLFMGNVGGSKYKFPSYVAYSLGVATVYTDKIVEGISTLLK